MRLNDLNNCYEDVSPTSGQKQRMLNAILERKIENEGGKAINKGIKKRLALAAALAAALVLVSTTVLAVSTGWHIKLMEYFSIGSDQIALLEGAVDTPGISVTDSGVTIEVLQTLVDSQSVYVIYEVTLHEYADLADSTVARGYLYACTEQDDGYLYMSQGSEMLEISGNRIIAIADFTPSAPIMDGTLRLVVDDIEYFAEAGNSGDGLGVGQYDTLIHGEWVALINGKWELEWDFTYTDISKKIMPNQAVGTDGDAIITEISISPVSICITGEGAKGCSLEGLLDYGQLDPDKIMVSFIDGSMFMFSARETHSSFNRYPANEHSPGYVYRMLKQLNRVIDPDEVASVTVCGVTIPVG